MSYLDRCYPPKRCLACDKQYTPRSGAQQYCSACARARNEARRRKYYEEHREESLAKSKADYQRNRDKILLQHKLRYYEICEDPTLKKRYLARKRKERALRRAKRDIIAPNDEH